MAQIDITRVAFAGFGLIRRNPIAPLIWGLVQTVLSIIPFVFIAPVMMQMFATIITQSAGGGEPDMSQIMAYQAQMNMVAPLSWIVGLLSYGLITGATFRAILAPADGKWFFMRIGMAEVMLVVVTIVWVILFVIALLPAALVVGIGAAIGSMISQGAAILVGIVLGLVAAVGLIWVGIRMSLAMPMSFDRKSFLLFESWKLTKGNALALFLAGLINFIIVMILSWIMLAIALGVGAGVALSGGGLEALQAEDFNAFFAPDRLAMLIPVGILLMIISIAINGYVSALMTAPSAEAYRQLVPKTDEVF